ncbi:MAG: peptidase M28, partial [Allosphingosinicella sp.]
MRLRLVPVVLAALATAALPVAASAQQAQPQAAAPEFTADRFRAHVAFLADDLLEGRQPGTRGYDLAALYVATRFEALGLKPAGDGGWYQQVPFVEYRMADAPAALTIGGRRFAHGETVILSATPSEAPLTLEAPVVFAGYGLSAPAAGLDDYAGLDVKGKVVAVLNGVPDGLPSDVSAHLNAEKRRMAEAQGAIGMITIRGRSESASRPFAQMARWAGAPAMTWVGKDGTPFSPA